MHAPAMVLPSARGIFCKFQGQQWGPGSDRFFESRDDPWCRANFPFETTERQLLESRGAVWVRRLDGRWIICHTCIPQWSSVRSTPSWALVSVSDQDFETAPILGAAIADVLSATVSEGSKDRWAQSQATWPATPWDRRTVGVLASMFDATLRGGHRDQPWTILPEGMLDPPGLTALQLMLVAMYRSGVQSPAAVVVREPGWSVPAVALPAGAMVFEQSPPLNAAGGAPMIIRGVDVCSFASGFVECATLLQMIAKEFGRRGVAPTDFREAATQFVPLSSIDPSELKREEWDPWVAGVCQSPGNVGEIERRINSLLERIERGEKALVGLAIRLAAAWCEVAMSPERAGDQRPESRVDGWIARLVRRG
jgi:hypothetical protein